MLEKITLIKGISCKDNILTKYIGKIFECIKSEYKYNTISLEESEHATQSESLPVTEIVGMDRHICHLCDPDGFYFPVKDHFS
jgi:hypothetical protein